LSIGESVDGHVVVDEPVYDCEACRDRGVKVVLKDHRGVATFAACECQGQKLAPARSRALKGNPAEVKRLLKLAGLEKQELLDAWSPWDENLQKKPTFARNWLFWALRDAADCPVSCWSGDPPRAPRSPWSLCLLGEPGRGKTKTAATLSRMFLEAGGTGLRWARVPEAFDTVQGERRTESLRSAEKSIVSASLLVLDELGAAHRYNVETMNATVEEWLAARERRRFPTIVTTNATGLDQLEGRIASRLSAGVYRIMKSTKDARDA
jgi:hypothetical protein